MTSRPGDASQRSGAFFDQGLFLLHLNRGKEEMRKGHWDAARVQFEEARRLRAQDAEVLANLAFAYFHLGDLPDAERLTREVLTTHPGSPPLLFNLGLILYKAGRTAEAREPLERVVAAVPGHRKAHLTLGLVFQRLGDTERAKRHLRSAGADRRAGDEGDDTVSRAARAAHAAPPAGPGPDGRERTSPIVQPEAFGTTSGPIAATASGPVSAPGSRSGPIPRPLSEPPAPVPVDAPAGEKEPSTAPVLLRGASGPIPDREPSSPQGSGPLRPIAAAELSGTEASRDGALQAARTASSLAGGEAGRAHVAAATSNANANASASASAGATAAAADIAIAAPAEPPGPFRSAPGGFLAAEVSGGLVVSRAAVAGRRGVPVLATAPGPGALPPLLARASGDGTLLLVSRGRRPWLTRLAGGFLSVDPERLLGFEAAILFREDPAFELRRVVDLPFLKLLGEGMVAIAVRNEPALFEVTETEPLTVAAASVAAYAGGVTAELLEDADPLVWGPGPVLRFTGVGTVLADP